MENSNDFMYRKAEERAQFQRGQRLDFEIGLLKFFVSLAAKWKLGKKDAAEREIELRHLRKFGIEIEDIT